MHPSPAATAPPRYLIGIDGGGTRTRARLADGQGRLLGRGEAGPSGLSQGIAPAWVRVQSAIGQAFLQAAVQVADPAHCALGLGLAGAGSPTLAAAFRAAAPAYALLVLDTDAAATWWGAHGGAPGAIVAAGTGSVGLAQFADGRRVLVGGWGVGVGDEGGGAWLGRHALQLAQRALDGRAATGALAQAVWQAAGGRREALAAWGAQAGQPGLARLAPLVFEHAESDDQARQLLDHAAAELALIAQALDRGAELPLAITGSIGSRLLDRLLRHLPAAARARCVPPAADAAQGALQLLMQHRPAQAAAPGEAPGDTPGKTPGEAPA